MQLQGMTIALRQRMPWEATDLGVALVRAHAKRIFAAWCLVTLPIWVLVNALGVAIQAPWVALLAMWWLKPMFDRIPLYAISRAVFGRIPGVREIVRAQFTWGWGDVWPWLLWRRLHPSRLLLLPADLLERANGGRRSERVRVLTKGDAGPRNQLVMLGSLFELILSIAVVTSVLMFVPSAFLSDASANLFHHVFDHPPLWVQVALNACIWFGTSLVEPFLVGAGFGLYLNRRVQLEAWDVEHAFRRIAARLTRGGAQSLGLVLALALAGFAVRPAEAMQAPACPQGTTQTSPALDSRSGDQTPACTAAPDDDRKPTATSLAALFGAGYRRDGAAFSNHVKQARAKLTNTVRDWEWVSHDEPKQTPARDQDPPGWLGPLGDVVGFVWQYGLWIIAALLIGFALYHHKVWISWVRELRIADPESLVETREVETPVTLPRDIPSAVRALWQRGEQRAALALLYQAAVQRLADRLGTPLPPGATEGECLVRSRQLNDRRYAGLFARIVGCWQAAAYARRMPETTLLEALLSDWTAPAPVTA